jgi:hypothetical protein
MFQIKRERIYTHSHLDQRAADRLRPLMENAFRGEFESLNDRPQIKEERLKFVTEQYANRCRVAGLAGENPLYEDAKIFGGLNSGLKNLFESVSPQLSSPQNIIGMGNVRNPMNATDVPGGMWNNGYKAGSGDIPSYIFGLQNHIAIHCIGFDLIPTIAVDTPKPVIIYIDTVYGGGALDSIESLPTYIELASKLFTQTWITTNNLVRASSELVIVADTGGTKSAMKVLFFVGSTVKSAITVEVKATGKMTTAPINGTSVGEYVWDNTVSVQSIANAINTAGIDSIIAIEDETTPANTYVSPITQLFAGYASATRTNIAEAATNNNVLGGMSRAQHEKGPHNKLNVVAIDKQLEMVGLEIEADTTNIQIKDMAAMGVNVISYLYTGVQNQLVQSLDEVIIDHLYKLGVEHSINAWLSQGINHSLYIDASSNSELNVATGIPVGGAAPIVKIPPLLDVLGNDRRAEFGTIKNALVSTAYENQMTHNERLYNRILKVAEFVELDTRIAPADCLVASGEICASIKAHSTFAACPTPTTITKNPGLQHYGNIFGTIAVYKNPKVPFNDPRILLLRRGDDKDPGAKLLAYDLAASRQVVDRNTMAEAIRVWSRFAIADVGFYPELSYYMMLAINTFSFS